MEIDSDYSYWEKRFIDGVDVNLHTLTHRKILINKKTNIFFRILSFIFK
jgi:hypothetical protein